MMLRSVGSLLIVGSIAVFPYAGNAAPQALMSAQEILTSLIGNTITGVEDNERYVEYLSPDGRILGRSESGAYSGNWRIEGDKLCVAYDKKITWDCVALRLNGNQLVWVVDPDGGDDLIASVSKGNSEYLRAAALPPTGHRAADPSSAEIGMRRQPADLAATPTEPANKKSSTIVGEREGVAAGSNPGRPEEAKRPADAAAVPAGQPHDDAAAIVSATAPEAATHNGAAAAAGVAPQRAEPAAGAAAASTEAPVPETSVSAAEAKDTPERRMAAVTIHARHHKASAHPGAKAAYAKLAAMGQKSRRVRVVHRSRSPSNHFSSAGRYRPIDEHTPIYGREPLLAGEDRGRVPHKIGAHAHWHG